MVSRRAALSGNTSFIATFLVNVLSRSIFPTDRIDALIFNLE